MMVRTTASRGTDIKLNRSVNDEILPHLKITIYVLRFTGKTIKQKFELRLSNGLEPTKHEKGRMTISNRLRPIEILKRDRCAIGWAYIYPHSTNPVK